jgi:DNA-binding transcriptional regulator YiaG
MSTRPKQDIEGRTFTVTVPSPEGPRYMVFIINYLADQPVEVFIKDAPGSIGALSNALARLVSLAFQNKVPVDRVIKMLSVQYDSNETVRWNLGHRSVVVSSIPDALCKLLLGMHPTGSDEVEIWNKAKVGLQIKACRRFRNMTQEQLSEASAVSANLISSYELGKRNPGIDNLMLILKALEIRPMDFFNPDNNPSCV